jgi:alkanesulfonate monooxygenase SsuD/methylene tetrahydromethanopterin reductase-like flavin-dependent oxidoreductase (luciferase family)
VASFGGEFISFDAVRVNPKPVRDRRIPVILGANTDAALGRAAAWGDGWYGFNLADGAAVTERLATLERLCHESGRSLSDLHVAVALASPDPREVGALAASGVDELVVVVSPPADGAAVTEWVAALARALAAVTSVAIRAKCRT